MTEQLREENTPFVVIYTVVAYIREGELCTNAQFVLSTNVVHLI